MPQLCVDALCGDIRRRTLVAQHQRVVVGRSEWSGLSMPHDPGLHDQHLALVGSGGEFRLVPNPVAGPVFLNDEVVQESVLADGDVIRVASTVLRISIRGEASPPTRVKIVERTCESGVIATTSDELPLGRLVSGLLPAPCHIVLERSVHRATSQFQSAVPVYETGHSDLGPVLLSPSDEVDTSAILLCEWQSGSVVALLTPRSQPSLLPVVRNLPASYSDASLLQSQLEYAPKVFAEFLVSSVDGILLRQKVIDQWVIYSREGMRQEIDKALNAARADTTASV